MGLNTSTDKKGKEGEKEKSTTSRPTSNYNYDEAVLKVQEWNEALKCTFLMSCGLFGVKINYKTV